MPKLPDLPVGPLPDLLAWWRSTKVKGYVIGGLAIAFVGRARVTRDVDAVVILPEERWAAFLKKAEPFNFVPRIPDALAFAKTRRIFLLHHAPSGIDVDISVGGTQFEQNALERAKNFKVGRQAVPVASPEDMIVFKTIAGRDHDLKDISGILDANADVEYEHIRKHVDEFAQILEMPQMYLELDVILRRHEQKNQRRKKRPAKRKKR